MDQQPTQGASMSDDKPESPHPWMIVAISFLALALAFSTRATYGLVIPHLEQEFGWTRSFTSSIAAAALLMTALLAPLAGRFVDKQGARAVIIVGLGLLSLGCILAAITSNPWAFIIAFAGVAATGFGLLAVHVVSTVVEQEFDSNQGFATGIATSGSTAGQFLILPLLAVLLATYDWRWAFAALGASSLTMMLCVMWWLPNGTRNIRPESGPVVAGPTILEDIWQIAKMPAFQILFWSYFLCGYTTSGVIETHFLPYASFCGFGPVPSATAFGLLSAINLVGMILVGWLTDRVHRPLLLGGIYVIRGLSFIILVNVGADLNTLLVFAVIFGLVDYSTTPVTASLVASHIGIRVMGLAFGLVTAGHQVGGAVGAYFGGVLFDIYARYDWVWWSSLWLAVLAGFLVFILRDKPRHTAALA